MKNLPARLRKHADEVLDPGYPYHGTPEMVREAADEIERLWLTDEDREAIEFTLNFLDWPLDGSQLAVVARTLGPACEVPEHRIKAMLRRLLERTSAR